MFEIKVVVQWGVYEGPPKLYRSKVQVILNTKFECSIKVPEVLRD